MAVAYDEQTLVEVLLPANIVEKRRVGTTQSVEDLAHRQSAVAVKRDLARAQQRGDVPERLDGYARRDNVSLGMRVRSCTLCESAPIERFMKSALWKL